MSENQTFGTRLRELRTKAGMSLRELAERVNVDFTYLSKIENGALPPPSEKVISQLAETLNVDKDEMLAMAGKIPSDIAEILKDRKTLEKLRQEQARKEKKNATSGVRTASRPKVSTPLKVLSRLALPVLLVIAVAASMWYASPTKALQINISNPSSGTLGDTYTFWVTVSIENHELLPLKQVDIAIFKVDEPTRKATLANLPKNDSNTSAQPVTPSNAGTATVAANADDNWDYYFGGGYVNWMGSGYYFTPPNDWGYGYKNPFVGTTTITYTIVWTSPSDWPAGDYNIETKLIASSKTFTKPGQPFTLSEAPPPPAGGGAMPSGMTYVADAVNTEGVFQSQVTAKSDDNKVTLVIPQGVTGKTIYGEPLSSISITQMLTPPAPPTDGVTIGLTYDFKPAGATFDPPITVTFNYTTADIPTGVSELNMKIAYYDSTGTWVPLQNITVNTTAKTISGTLSHFTPFGVLAYTNPAVFTVSNLTITPAEVNVGQSVTISATVSNTGDLSGNYAVALKINDVVTSSQVVTLAGHTSTVVTFTTSMNTAGTYTITIGTVSGTLTVKALPPTTTPPTTTPPTTTPPTTTPPTTTPTNWWLYGGIIAAVIIVAALAWLLVTRRRD